MMRLSYGLLWLFGPRSFVGSMIADKMVAPSVDGDRSKIVDAVRAALARCDRRGLLLAARSAMFQREDLVPRLHEVRVPTIFFAGAADTLLTVEEARAQVSAIPDCRFVVVERSSHQSALEAPEQLIPVLREAVGRWSGGALRGRTNEERATVRS